MSWAVRKAQRIFIDAAIESGLAPSPVKRVDFESIWRDARVFGCQANRADGARALGRCRASRTPPSSRAAQIVATEGRNQPFYPSASLATVRQTRSPGGENSDASPCSYVASIDGAKHRNLKHQLYPRTVAHVPKASKAAERRVAIERTRGMFAHVAPGESLAEELIADRRAEVHAEELHGTEQRRRRDAD